LFLSYTYPTYVDNYLAIVKSAGIILFLLNVITIYVPVYDYRDVAYRY